MSDVIKKIIKESINNKNNYKKCDYFIGNQKNYELCLSIELLGGFLYKELGLGNFMKKVIDTIGEVKDVNDQYQYPLKLLHQTGKFNDSIQKIGNLYYSYKLKNKTTVFDRNGEWDYVNKLNTNYSDLSELLTELFIRKGLSEELVASDTTELKKYLLSIKEDLHTELTNYFSIDEYREFVRNSKITSDIGEESEIKVKNILESDLIGMETLYHGGNGDFIDMIFGVDLIMGYKNKIYLIQVKSSRNAMEKSYINNTYKKIDYFAAPTRDGIVIKNRNKPNEITHILNNGTILKEKNL